MLFSHDPSSPAFQRMAIQLAWLGSRATQKALLEREIIDQAVQDLGKVIETNPTNPIPYLERGIAQFGLGQYEQSLEDYKQYTVQTQKTNPPSLSDFALSFAKTLPKGVYESGEGMLLFFSRRGWDYRKIQRIWTYRNSISAIEKIPRRVPNLYRSK